MVWKLGPEEKLSSLDRVRQEMVNECAQGVGYGLAVSPGYKKAMAASISGSLRLSLLSLPPGSIFSSTVLSLIQPQEQRRTQTVGSNCSPATSISQTGVKKASSLYLKTPSMDQYP
jgi:hypothetical protein